MPSTRGSSSRTRALVALSVAVLAVTATPGCTDLLGGGLRSTWAYEMTELDRLAGEDLTGRGVRVAVVDTGIDADHPDLADARIVAWRDFVDGRSQPYDDNGHGSHVAGIIVAQGAESNLRGGAPGVDLLVAKAINEEGSGTDQAVAEAIDWARRQNADVISLSLGGGRLPVLGSATEDAAQRAVDAGVYVVAAAGNDGEDDDGTVATPANVPGVIAVGAVDRSRQVASFSSRGSQSRENVGGIGVGERQDPHKKPEVVAPGVRVTSTWMDGEYRQVSGTSQAVPFVSASLALSLEAEPSWQREGANGGSRSDVTDLKRHLKDSAEKIPGQSTPHDNRAGYGLVQAQALRQRLG